mgnify:CR=1 FL=1
MISIVVIFVGFLCICALFYKVPKGPGEVRAAEQAKETKLKQSVQADSAVQPQPAVVDEELKVQE